MNKVTSGVGVLVMMFGFAVANADDLDADEADKAVERSCVGLQADLLSASAAKAKAAKAPAAVTKAKEDAAKAKENAAKAKDAAEQAKQAADAAEAEAVAARAREKEAADAAAAARPAERAAAMRAKAEAAKAAAAAAEKAKAAKAAAASAEENATKAAAAEESAADLAIKLAGEHVVKDKVAAGRCLTAAQRAGVQAGGTDIASTLIATAGQIVIDRATGVAWNILARKLKQAAGCDDDDHAKDRLPATCTVLRDLRLQDLVASPSVLLDAAVKDLITKIRQQLTKELDCKTIGEVEVCPGAIIDAALTAWYQGGNDALEESLRSQLSSLAIDVLAMKGTDIPPPFRGAGLFARCALVQRSMRPLAECPLVAELDSKERAAILPYAALVDAAVRVRTRGAVLDAATAVVLELYPDSKPVLDGIENVLAGLVAKDWNKVSAGAIAIIHYYVKKKQETPAGGAGPALTGKVAAAAIPPLPDFIKEDTRLYRLLASVGQYAATYLNKDMEPEAANKARREAIESLIDSMTDRSQRSDGAVISLGGEFGFGWGQRTQGSDDAHPTPFHLAFGVAVDTYSSSSKCGAHAMLTLVDASNYVAFEDKDFKVVDPDAKSSLAIGLTLGVRFAEKQTPVFIGGNITYAPFVDIDTDDMQSRGSYQVMGLVGVYVPFIDFN